MFKIFRNSRRVIILALVISLGMPASAGFAKKRSRGTGLSARAVIFSDSTRGVRLYGKNVDQRIFVASTTKVMTALLVLEKLPLDQYVTVSARATRVQPSKLYLKPGDQYRVRDLLYAILLNSANDASVVLAEAVADSEANFVDMMNQRAKQLGADNTKFANPHGLPSKTAQYSTAYDMYLIFRQAIKNDFFRRALRYRYRTIFSKDGRKHSLKTHNTTLFKGWKQDFYGKTGYTKAAGFCFIGYTQKGKNILILGVFGCKKRRAQDMKYIAERFGGLDL